MDKDSDLPPPLEDLTEQVEHRFGKDFGKEDDAKPVKLEAPKEPVKKQEKPKQNADDGSTWFKKGFLVNPPQKSKVEDITHVKAKPETKNQFPDIQKAVQATSNQWLTPDLLSNIMSNDVMKDSYQNPELQQAINLFQSDPKKALELYGKMPQFQAYLNEFSKIMASHFGKLAAKPK